MRRLQRGAHGAQELRPARRDGGGGAAPRRADDLPPRRARGDRGLGQRGGQPARPRVPEPPLRPPVHPRSRRECRRGQGRAAVEAWELVLAFAGAFVAGYLGSMLGLVLGTLRLPLIVLATGNPLAAAGTNIAISAAAAGAGSVRHAREGRVDWRGVAWTAPPSVAGRS